MLTESGLPGGATGTVSFASGGTTLCVATLPATACASPALLSAGDHPITATYTGDSTFSSSTATTTLTIAAAATSTTVTSSRNPIDTGQTVVYTASVAAHPGSGTISFTAKGLSIAGCTAVAVNPDTDTATCSTTYSSAGAHIIGARFSGNVDFAASSAPTTGVLALKETVGATVTVPSTGAGDEGNPAASLAGGVVVILGFLTVLEATRRRLRG